MLFAVGGEEGELPGNSPTGMTSDVHVLACSAVRHNATGEERTEKSKAVRDSEAH